MRSNLKQLKKIYKLLFAGILAFGVLLPALTASAIARGYNTSDSGLQTGMVVALSVDSSDSSQVERATQAAAQRVVGIVTTLDKSLVTVTSSGTKVLVESEGEVDAYVSDMGGAAHKGDSLVISPLKGILMKSSDGSDTVIGIASADFSETTAEAHPIADGSTTKNVHIAKLKINLNKQGATNPQTTDSSLSRLGRKIVGREVSEIRILVALLIFFLVLVAEGSILYGGISSAIAALGRNPLARKIIRHELVRVVIIALMVLLIGLGAIYTILWV